MADATEYNVRWPLYDPPSFSSPSLSVATAAKKCITTTASARPSWTSWRRGRGGDSPRTWPLVGYLGRVDRSCSGGREESLLDVRQRRTSMLRGKCGVTSPRVVNSQELSCTQKRTRDKANSPLLKPLSRSSSAPLRSPSGTGKPTMF